MRCFLAVSSNLSEFDEPNYKKIVHEIDTLPKTQQQQQLRTYAQPPELQQQVESKQQEIQSQTQIIPTNDGQTQQL